MFWNALHFMEAKFLFMPQALPIFYSYILLSVPDSLGHTKSVSFSLCSEYFQMPPNIFISITFFLLVRIEWLLFCGFYTVPYSSDLNT